MKKKFLIYLTVITALLSLESCVTNYVVSKPIEYNMDAKLVAITKKSALDSKIASPSKQISAALASLETSTRNAEIAKPSVYDTKLDALLVEAESYLGTPYRFGGMSRNGIDCSAFVLSVYNAVMGTSLPRVAASQALEGKRVEKSDLKKGDLVFFSKGSRISHVGIVHDVTPEGEVRFIHAASSRGVMISPLNDNYWGPKFRFARRILKADPQPITIYAQNK